MTKASRWPWLGLAACAIACHNNVQSGPVVGRVSEVAISQGERPGTYPFEIPLDRTPLRGTITVIADTVLLDPERDSCRPAPRAPDVRFIMYECIGSDYELLAVNLDRHAPTSLSSWSVTTKVTKQRRVCGQYGYDDKGRQICLRYEMQSYDETSRRGGRLRVDRAPNP